MGQSAAISRPGEVNQNIPNQAPPSKLKTYGFVIAMILGMGGLAVGAAGIAGYFQVGALSNLSQIDALTMMGFGLGTTLFMLGVLAIIISGESNTLTQERFQLMNKRLDALEQAINAPADSELQS